MSASLHSPSNLPNKKPSEHSSVTRVTRRPVRADGFGNRFPVLFDHRDDMPARELAHWGPGSRILLESFLIPAFILIVAAIIAIVWYAA